MTENIYTFLASHPFCTGFPQDALDSLAECASVLHYQSGDFIFRQHQDASAFFLIIDGKVDVELFSTVGGPVVLQSLKAGEALGWSWLIAPFRWNADARVLEETRVIRLNAEALRSRMSEDPKFGYRVLERLVPVLAHRLESASLRFLSIYGAHS